jgi:NAD+ kinase
MTSPPRVLCIYKKSAYQIYVHERRHTRVEQLLSGRDPAVAGLHRAHREHERTVAEARRLLRALGARATFRRRSARGSITDFDLIVTLGGDGTLLWASHAVGATCPVIAINSAPKDSVGYFCAADRASMGDALAAALSGRSRETKLARMRVEIDGEECSTRVLNDVLFCHLSPAATSRYALGFRGRREEHKSSGVWIATPAGSAAAIRSAGGRLLPASSAQLQFVVREPYTVGKPRYRLLKGVWGEGEQLKIQSHMRTGRLYLDGPHVWKAVEIGSWLRFSRSHEPLSLLGFRAHEARRS